MKLPEFRRQDPGDYGDFQELFDGMAENLGTKAPQIEELFQSTNQSLERITSLLQRKIAFQDNFNSDAVTMDMESLTAIRFTPNIKGQPREAVVVKVLDWFVPYSFAWRPIGQAGQVEAVIHWLVVPETPKAVTWRVWGA